MPYRPHRSGLAELFTRPGVVTAYQHRPPYPPEAVEILDRLATDHPRRVLDLGAGNGALARPLAALVERVDAVDVSAAMVDDGRRQPGGDRDTLRWVVAEAQTCPLDGPYALVTAGASMHWMPWAAVLSHIAPAMSPNAVLALVEHSSRDVPWMEELTAVVVRHSRSLDYDPHWALPEAMRTAGHFEPVGRADTTPVPFHQTVESYVEYFHSTASLAREHMSPDEADDFDRIVERIVRPHAVDGVLSMTVVATVTWGRPRP